MKVPVVVIRVPLYDYNEHDQRIPFTKDQVEEVIGYIRGKDDVCGYSIDSIEITEEEWDND